MSKTYREFMNELRNKGDHDLMMARRALLSSECTKNFDVEVTMGDKNILILNEIINRSQTFIQNNKGYKMDKENIYDLMIQFMKYAKVMNENNFIWCIEDMEKDGLFKNFGENAKEQFENMF